MAVPAVLQTLGCSTGLLGARGVGLDLWDVGGVEWVHAAFLCPLGGVGRQDSATRARPSNKTPGQNSPGKDRSARPGGDKMAKVGQQAAVAAVERHACETTRFGFAPMCPRQGTRGRKPRLRPCAGPLMVKRAGRYSGVGPLSPPNARPRALLRRLGPNILSSRLSRTGAFLAVWPPLRNIGHSASLIGACNV